MTKNNNFLGPLQALILIVVLCVALIPASPKAYAEPAAQDEEAEATEAEGDEEEEIKEELSFFATTTVTATGSEVDTFTIPTPVTVIEAEEIEERAPDNAADLLRNEPGVDVNGIGPNQARPIIRGQRGHRVLFMEDGLRLNNPRRQSDFGEITGIVDINNVETVEVVRGPSSILYGSDAIGGVLNLVTKVPAAGTGSQIGGALGLRYSSADEQEKANLTVRGHSGSVAYSLGGTFRDAKNYESGSGSFGDIEFEDNAEVNDTALKDDAINAYVGARLSDKHSIFFKYNRYRADETGFGWVDPELLGETDVIRIFYPFQDFDRFTFGYFGGGMQSAIADTADVKAYRSDNKRELANDITINIGPAAPVPGWPDSFIFIDSLNFTDIETLGLRAELTKIGGEKHLITYGGEWVEDDSFNTDTSTFMLSLRFPFPPFEQNIPTGGDDIANTPNAENTNYGVFIQDEILVTDRFKATIGARYNKVETQAKPTPGKDITGLDFDDDQVVGAVNLLYSLTDRLNLIGSYGTAFRAPNIIERLFKGPTPEGFGFQISNPNLVSEEGENFDIGLKYRTMRAFIEAVYFENDLDNGIIQYELSDEEIAALPPALQEEIEASGLDVVVQQRNAEALQYKGFELAGGYRFDSGFSLGGNYTTLDAKSITGATDPTGNAVEDKLNLYLRYDQRQGRWWAEYRFRRNGDQQAPVESAVGLDLPGFTVHRVAGGVTLFQKGRQRHYLGAIVDNVTDELYAETSNASFFRPQPGLNAMGLYGFTF